MAFRTNKMPVLQTKSASGSVATFNTALAMPLPSCKIAVNAWQEGSGEPSPSNSRAISGYSAINIGSDAKYAGFINFNQLVDVSTLSDNYQWHSENITNNGSNKFTITFSSDETSRCWLICDLANDFTLVANHKYIMLPQFKISNGSLANYKFTFRFQNGNTQIDSIEQVDIQNGSMFIPTQSGNINKLSFYNYGDSTISSSSIITIQILLFDITQMFGSTIADYIYSLGQVEGVAYFRSLFPNNYYAYNAGTLTTVSAVNGVSGSMNTIQIGSTIYGGEYDARTGVLTVTHGYREFDGSENWINVGGSYPQAFQIDTGITNAFQGSLTTQRANNITNLYPWASDEVVQYGIRWQLDVQSGRLYVYDNNYSSNLAGFTQHLSDTHLQVVYLLNNPITIQLPPCPIDTLEGVNNIWADTGDIDLTYKDLDIAKRGNFREVFKLPS